MSARSRPRAPSGGGKVIDYTTCPLCGMNKVGVRTFQAVGTDHEIVQRRQAMGRGNGGGFQRLEGQGIRLENLAREQPALYQNLLEQARILIAELEETGGQNG